MVGVWDANKIIITLHLKYIFYTMKYCKMKTIQVYFNSVWSLRVEYKTDVSDV